MLILVGLAVLPLRVMFAHVSDDFGEGWNAYWTQAAVGPGPLYNPARIFSANNYPPLFFYLTEILGGPRGDYILVGRVVALVSLLGVGVLIGRIVALAGAAARWSILTALLFLAYNVVFFRQFVAVSNPQWTGQLLALASLVPLVGLKSRSLGTKRLWISAALLVLGGLVKHNQFALPLATTVWLFQRERRALAIWLAAGACWSALACVILYLCFGSGIFAEVIGFKRTLSMSNFADALSQTACFAGLAIACTLGWQRVGWASDQTLIALLAAFGVLFGLLERLGDGVAINAQFDALIGLTMLCGLLIGRCAAARSIDKSARSWRARIGPWIAVIRTNMVVRSDRWMRAGLFLLAIVPLLAATPQRIALSARRLAQLPREEALWGAMIDDARRAHGPVLCEMLAACYWAGQPLTVDFFAYGQKLRGGKDVGNLRAMIVSRQAPIIIVQRADSLLDGNGRLPAPYPGLIVANYRIVRAARNASEMVRR